jgi:hypothetical protein
VSADRRVIKFPLSVLAWRIRIGIPLRTQLRQQKNTLWLMYDGILSTDVTTT